VQKKKKKKAGSTALSIASSLLSAAWACPPSQKQPHTVSVFARHGTGGKVPGINHDRSLSPLSCQCPRQCNEIFKPSHTPYIHRKQRVLNFPSIVPTRNQTNIQRRIDRDDVRLLPGGRMRRPSTCSKPSKQALNWKAGQQDQLVHYPHGQIGTVRWAPGSRSQTKYFAHTLNIRCKARHKA
jgi:hypothetical protein